MMSGSRWMRVCAALGLVLVAIGITASLAAAECTTSFLRTFGGEPYGRLSVPRDVAIDSKGNAWVADTGHSRVQEFNSSGEFVTQFEVEEGILALALDTEGDIWTVVGNEVSAKLIREYSPGGEVKSSFASKKAFENGWFESARDLAVDSSGNILVLDAGFGSPARVQKFNSKGEYLSKFGESGTGNGQFTTPEAIVVDSEGNVLVADTGNNRYQEFNPAGEFVRKVGSEGTGNGQFKSPRGIAVDSEGKVWVTDSGNNRIERFSAKGAYLSQFGIHGLNDGQFNAPRGIAISGSNLWVADTGSSRVQEFSCL